MVVVSVKTLAPNYNLKHVTLDLGDGHGPFLYVLVANLA